MKKKVQITALPYIISEVSVTVIYDNKPFIVHSSDKSRYEAAKKAIIEGNWEAVYGVLDIVSAIEDFSDGDISVVDGEVFYQKKEKLHGVVVDKLLELLRAGLSDAKPLVKFIANLLQNPSKSSVDELYDFLSYKSLPIDGDGFVLAYKGVNSDGWSCTGNRNTKVLQGKVDARGRILNTVGATIEVERRHVDDDRRRECSHGLHVGSYDYAKGFSQGKLLLVRFNPKDAVAVPRDCSCQKLRVCKYEVLAEIADQQEIKAPYVEHKARTSDTKTNAGWNNPRDSKGRFVSKKARKVRIR